MLLRTNTSSIRPVDGHLAALAGERVFCSEFKYRRGTEVFGEGEETEYVYQIISGTVRTYKLLADGRRQINSFHLPGDMFGLENGATHRFTAEAVIETRVRITRRRSLLETMQNRQSGASSFLGLVTRNLQHAENHMLLLGRKTALERVAAFLLELDERLGHPSVLVLPMSRRDIADYLGLTLETVSRACSTLRDQKMLKFEGATQRQIVLLDRKGLAEHDA
ncbi:transcriptional regulator [Bradyrhizobium sp. WBOS7]|uniref:Transcriptional regulator n=1 Tax=Bradyrhizobium betae TaxID=244734 RepID=A0AAE9NBA5_9BRAD|nr:MULTISPECIES: helix-turn-helix domain-containing protein [Bradyrhizobium]MDD1569813.1 transcriptional regulator [Bradyrhizobium sp. WBOS1]UUO35717.1 transcriptional regulator [Bradyrhizobium sp. WBOS01]MDD1526502.1 transcriptional regulator [Bradyrhizobium sp. WBOS2]MDD1575912.1 transcriptional regulator [Bradyrhizobium sp. WBOS7]MDD1599499.1 transcriptional regulator [Bradyrhizobium sp. WBOS16]